MTSNQIFEIINNEIKKKFIKKINLLGLVLMELKEREKQHLLLISQNI